MALSLATKRPLTNQLSYLIKIFPLILRHESAARFIRPVDYVAFDIPDYPIVVKYPMDMQCVFDRLQMQFYGSVRDCLADIAQVFTNCFIFCAPDESIIEEAILLHHFVQEKLSNMPEREGRSRKVQKPNREMELCLQMLEGLTMPVVPSTDVPGTQLDLSYIRVNAQKGAYTDKVQLTADVYMMINAALLDSSTSPESAKKCWAFEEEFLVRFLNTFGERCDSCMIEDSVYMLTRALKTQRNINSLILENGIVASGCKQQVDSLVSLFERREGDGKFQDEKRNSKRKSILGTSKDHHNSGRTAKISKY